MNAGTLTLVCRKCTRESVIPAPTMETAVELAKLRGWVADGEAYICPTCPAIRVTFHEPVGMTVSFMATQSGHDSSVKVGFDDMVQVVA